MKSAFLRIALGGAFLFLAGCAGRNIHRDLKSDTAILVRGWTMPTHGVYDAGDRGFDYSNAAIYQNTLVFGCQTLGVVSIYPELMRTRWTFPIRQGVVSELAVDKTSVFFGGGDGFLYALDANTGKVNWKYEIKNSLASKPTITGGRIFVTTIDGTVYALDANTGKWLWLYKRTSAETTFIHAVSSPLVSGNEVLVGTTDGFLIALSLEEGQLKWEKRLNYAAKFTDVDATPVFYLDTLYEAAYDGSLFALRPHGGDVIWKIDSGGSKRVLIEDQTIYFPSSDGFVYAISRSTGKTQWKFELDQGVPTQLVMNGDQLIFGSSHQFLYVINKHTGKGLYRFNAGDGSGFSGSPTLDLATKKLYILSMAGNLYQFSLRDKPANRPDIYRWDVTQSK